MEMLMEQAQPGRADAVRRKHAGPGGGGVLTAQAAGGDALSAASRRANAGPHASSLAALQAMVAQRACADCETVSRTMGGGAPVAQRVHGPGEDPPGAFPKRLGIGTWNVHGLGKKSKTRKVKLDSIHGLMRNNADWLDLLALQEVSDPKVLNRLGDDVDVLSTGPVLRTKGVDGKFATREVYPLLARPGSGWKVNGVETFGADDEAPTATVQDAEVIWRDHRAQQGKSDEAAKKLRTIEEKKTRPVVIYRLRNEDGRALNVGVVHTTPSGQEFGRRDVYGQLEKFLKYANLQSGPRTEMPDGTTVGGENWAVLGDYYLTPEAHTKKMVSTGARDRRETMGMLFPNADAALLKNPPAPPAKYPNLELTTPISATNWPTMHQYSGDLSKVQIADFLIASGGFRSRAAGLLDLQEAGLRIVDEDHESLRRTMKVSDHAPMGAILSFDEADEHVDRRGTAAASAASAAASSSSAGMDDVYPGEPAPLEYSGSDPFASDRELGLEDHPGTGNAPDLSAFNWVNGGSVEMARDPRSAAGAGGDLSLAQWESMRRGDFPFPHMAGGPFAQTADSSMHLMPGPAGLGASQGGFDSSIAAHRRAMREAASSAAAAKISFMGMGVRESIGSRAGGSAMEAAASSIYVGVGGAGRVRNAKLELGALDEDGDAATAMGLVDTPANEARPLQPGANTALAAAAAGAPNHKSKRKAEVAAPTVATPAAVADTPPPGVSPEKRQRHTPTTEGQ